MLGVSWTPGARVTGTSSRAAIGQYSACRCCSVRSPAEGSSSSRRVSTGTTRATWRSAPRSPPRSCLRSSTSGWPSSSSGWERSRRKRRSSSARSRHCGPPSTTGSASTQSSVGHRISSQLSTTHERWRPGRVGGTTRLGAGVGLVAATNRDLERAVAEARFREDLFYRLAVFRIHLPPLRERGDDVLLLADRFVRQLGSNMGKLEPGLSREARELLVAHSWPGNIRELQNAIERALILADGGLIAAGQLGIAQRPPHDVATPVTPTPGLERPTGARALGDLEKQMIVDALHRAHGNKSRAAAALGLSRTQLLRRVRR